MIHFREDYNRIQDPENKIGQDEPVILFRAQDRFFIAVVCFYIIIHVLQGLYTNQSKMMVKTCIKGLVKTWDWYENHKNVVKYPDI